MAEILPVSGFNDRVRLAGVLPLKTPFTLNIFPTNLCNFRCIYCAQSQGYDYLMTRYGMDKGTMSPGTMQKIVDQCKEFPGKIKLVSFMGHGEPLLNKHLPEMVRMVHHAAIAKRIEIITNASLLTHSMSDALISAGLTNLRISLQGVNEGSYRRICGKKIDYGALLEEIRYYYRHKKGGGVFVKVMDIALAEGEEAIFFEQFDGICDRMFIENVKPVYQGIAVGKDADLATDRYGNAHPQRKVCPLPFFSLSIWPNGDVTPCDAIYKPVILGNVNNESLLSMWTGKIRKDFLQEQLKFNKSTIPGCRDCCAPDDVSHPLDVLDGDAERLMDLL
jgi:radical SAM protein with 4Fe4S-binding SPASM domain